MSEPAEPPPDLAQAQEERALLALVAQRGRAANAAMRKLFDRYQGRFRAHLRARGFGAQDIDEATQKVWLDIWRKAGEFTADRVPGAWLWGFFRNAKNDLLRSVARRADRFIDGAEEDQSASGTTSSAEPSSPSPEVRRQTRDFEACVQLAFAAFKRQHPEDARWLYLRHVEEWELDQIAKYRESTPHATAQFVSMARKRFRVFVAHCLALQVG